MPRPGRLVGSAASGHFLTMSKLPHCVRPRVLLPSTTVSASLFLVLVRANLLGFDWQVILSPAKQIPKAILAGCYDLWFFAGLTLPFSVALRAVHRRRSLEWLICGVYLVAAVLTLAAAMVNTTVVEKLGTPFSYPWLYYSDFLMSVEAREGIRAAVNLPVMLRGLLVGAVMVGLSLGLCPAIDYARRRTSPRAVLWAGLPLIAVYFPVADWYLTSRHWPSNKLANPIVAFVRSLSVDPIPPILTTRTPIGPEEFQVAGERPAAIDAPSAWHGAGVRNALVFIFESLPAEWVSTYGGRHPVTPEIARQRHRAMQFSRFYAHAPASNYSLASILCSVYPGISYYSLTAEHPDIDLPSLSGVLQANGWRTAFFGSGDFTFQRGDQFLAHRGFDLVQDYRSRDCSTPRIINTREDFRILDGTDDLCTAEALAGWIAAEPERPFFAVLWTIMTHYPYYTQGNDTDFGVNDEYFNRYLNALREGDRAFGRVMQGLEDYGLADDTLVVVVGDHGEAFGRHDQVSHGQRIYEENVHIPLLLVNRRLFHGEENPTIGGLIDLAPTILDLLGHSTPTGWQGRSLFSPRREPRVYFFAPWTEFWFGYRENDRKLLLNASRNQLEIYDIAHDRFEERNLAAAMPEESRVIPQRLAAWVQYQNRMLAARVQSSHDSDDRPLAQWQRHTLQNLN